MYRLLFALRRLFAKTICLFIPVKAARFKVRRWLMGVPNILGRHSYTGVGFICDNMKSQVGAFCSIAGHVRIALNQHPTNFLTTHTFPYLPTPTMKKYKPKLKFEYSKPVFIGNDVWIGQNVIIMSGVTIGDGAVIGAGAIVTKDVPPFAIVGGVPAKLIRYRFDEKTREDLLRLKWWDLPDEEIQKLPFDDVQACIKQLDQLEAGHNLTFDAYVYPTGIRPPFRQKDDLSANACAVRETEA